MKLIYAVGIRFYGALIYFFSFFNEKAKLWVSGRADWQKKVALIPTSSYWFHCASLGEFDQAAPLIRLIKEERPAALVTVSFFSPSGMQHYQKRNVPVDFAVYMPLDTRENAKKFLKLLEPCLAVFVKYEFWLNHIDQCKKLHIPMISLSSIFRENQIYFKWYGKYFLQKITFIDYFFVQDEKSKKLLKEHGLCNVEVTGDTRFDTVHQNALKYQHNSDPILEQFSNKEFVLIIGSSWAPEERIVKQAANMFRSMKVIIAPHNVHTQNIERIQSSLEQPSMCYSKYDLNEKNPMERILILDTIGQLSMAYKYGDLAFVGGGFSGKLHNILEPAVFGLPICFGPKFSKFPEALLFLEKNIAHVVKNENELIDLLKRFEKKKDQRPNVQQIMEQQKGASQKVLSRLRELELY